MRWELAQHVAASVLCARAPNPHHLAYSDGKEVCWRIGTGQPSAAAEGSPSNGLCAVSCSSCKAYRGPCSAALSLTSAKEQSRGQPEALKAQRFTSAPEQPIVIVGAQRPERLVVLPPSGATNTEPAPGEHGDSTRKRERESEKARTPAQCLFVAATAVCPSLAASSLLLLAAFPLRWRQQQQT